jgi:hypothetical protein
VELRDAALAAAEAMGLSYEALGLMSAIIMVVLAIVRALWVHYRGTPFVVDRIDQLKLYVIHIDISLSSIYFIYILFITDY